MMIAIQIMCLWCIDISMSAMLNPGSILTNGWQERDPMLMYHIALYGNTLISVGLAVIGTHFILGEDKKDVGNK